MDPLEGIAVATGALTVWLSTRQRIAAWPTALVNAALYFVIFWRAQIYANMGLQVVYFGLSCYGWYAWKYGGADHTGVVVTRTTAALARRLVPIGIGIAALLTFSLARWTDAATPWLDSGTTATSLVAQWMMTRKLLENWLVWIAVDVVYIGMYVTQGLRLTAGLYAAFLVLATLGYLSWRRSLRERLAGEAGQAAGADGAANAAGAAGA
ncbi:MAG: nicotinamide riboside transporter PnuC [Gemmatimonadaceae bacterium]